MKSFIITFCFVVLLHAIHAQQILLSASLEDIQVQQGKLTYQYNDSLPGINKFHKYIFQPCLGIKWNRKKAPNRYLGFDLGFFSSTIKQKYALPADLNYDVHYFFSAPYKQLSLALSALQLYDFHKLKLGLYSEMKVQYIFQSMQEQSGIVVHRQENYLYSYTKVQVHDPAYLFVYASIAQSISKRVIGECYVEAGLKEGLYLWYRNGSVNSERVYVSQTQAETQTQRIDYHHAILLDFYSNPFIKINYFMGRKKKNSHKSRRFSNQF